MKILSTLVLSFLLYLPGIISAQEEKSTAIQDWKKFDARSSKKTLRQYMTLRASSYKWETNDRIKYLHKGYEAATELQLDSAQFLFSQQLGDLYRAIDSIQASLKYLNLSLTHSSNPAYTRTSYNSIGSLHMKVGDYNTGLEFLFKAVEEARKLGDGSETYPLGNITEVYTILEDYESALKYTRLSSQLSLKLDSPEKEYSLIYDNSYMTDLFHKLEQRDSAMFYLKRTLNYAKKIDSIKQAKFQDARFVAYFSAAEFYLKEKNPERARYFIDRTAENAQPYYKPTLDILETRLSLIKKEYTKGLEILLGINQEEINASTQEKILKLQIEILEQMQDYKSLSKIQESLLENQKEKFGEDRLRYSLFANAKFEAFQKNEEIKSLKQEQEIQSLTIQNQQILVLLTLALVLLFAGGAAFQWKRQIDRKKLNIYLQEQVELKTRDLQKANEELRILNYVASHDIKEPLRNIGSFSGLIQSRLPEEEKNKLKPYFTVIKSSIQQLYTLVEDIAEFMNFSKNEQIQKGEVDLNQVFQTSKTSLDVFIQEKDAVLVNHGLPKVEGNETMLFVILRNLMENGLKFNESERPKIELSYIEHPDTYQIIVSDNGIGIKTSYLNQVFESFKRLHNRKKYEGSGIGLSIVKLLTEKLGGHVSLQSEVGKGSSFSIFLPRK